MHNRQSSKTLLSNYSRSNNIIYDSSKLKGLRTVKQIGQKKSTERSTSPNPQSFKVDPRVGISSELGDGGFFFQHNMSIIRANTSNSPHRSMFSKRQQQLAPLLPPDPKIIEAS